MKSNFGIQPWTLVDLHNVLNILKDQRQVELNICLLLWMMSKNQTQHKSWNIYYNF
jgi:hypothetical protein